MPNVWPYCSGPSILDSRGCALSGVLSTRLFGEFNGSPSSPGRLELASSPGYHLTHDLFIISQIRWKVCFAINSSRVPESTIIFCTWHDSMAVVPRANFCSYPFFKDISRIKTKFRFNLNCDWKNISKTGPWEPFYKMFMNLWSKPCNNTWLSYVVK